MSEKKSNSSRPMGIGPGMGLGMAGGEKAKNFKETMLTLFKYISEFKLQIVIVIIFAIFSAIFSIVGPKILGKATTKLFDGLMAYYTGTNLLTDFRYIRNCILVLVVLYIISSKD